MSTDSNKYQLMHARFPRIMHVVTSPRRHHRNNNQNQSMHRNFACAYPTVRIALLYDWTQCTTVHRQRLPSNLFGRDRPGFQPGFYMCSARIVSFNSSPQNAAADHYDYCSRIQRSAPALDRGWVGQKCSCGRRVSYRAGVATNDRND